jgi:hypothetical protein
VHALANQLAVSDKVVAQPHPLQGCVVFEVDARKFAGQVGEKWSEETFETMCRIIQEQAKGKVIMYFRRSRYLAGWLLTHYMGDTFPCIISWLDDDWIHEQDMFADVHFTSIPIASMTKTELALVLQGDGAQTGACARIASQYKLGWAPELSAILAQVTAWSRPVAGAPAMLTHCGAPHGVDRRTGFGRCSTLRRRG